MASVHAFESEDPLKLLCVRCMRTLEHSLCPSFKVLTKLTSKFVISYRPVCIVRDCASNVRCCCSCVHFVVWGFNIIVPDLGIDMTPLSCLQIGGSQQSEGKRVASYRSRD